jgi:hypothetical protein
MRAFRKTLFYVTAWCTKLILYFWARLRDGIFVAMPALKVDVNKKYDTQHNEK